MRGQRRLVFLPPGGAVDFPDPELADDEGLIAVGGDLSPDRLLLAYERGIFPWYSAGLPPVWWSPNPRAVMDLERLHVSRSMRRILRGGRFSLSHNRAFARVMQGCAADRDGGTWILPEMVLAYTHLHQLGHAHSIEVWAGERLVGGLYGVQRGALFAAESMFHRETNASKLALIATLHFLFDAGVELFDVQFLTSHLESLGAYTISRAEYLERVAIASKKNISLPHLPSTLDGVPLPPVR